MARVTTAKGSRTWTTTTTTVTGPDSRFSGRSTTPMPVSRPLTSPSAASNARQPKERTTTLVNSGDTTTIVAIIRNTLDVERDSTHATGKARTAQTTVTISAIRSVYPPSAPEK